MTLPIWLFAATLAARKPDPDGNEADYDDTIEVRTLERLTVEARRRLSVTVHATLERLLPDMDRWAVADIADELDGVLEDEMAVIVEDFAESWIE